MSQLINIQQYHPHHSDKIFVDTNVWFWMTYAASNEIETENRPLRYQTLKYPELIEKILDSGANLYHSPLTLTELSNIIDRTECEIFNTENAHIMSRKKFRDIDDSRNKVIEEIKSAWHFVNGISTCIDTNLNKTLADKSLETFASCKLDAYDSFFVRIMQENGVDRILTDDRDFLTVNGLKIMTFRKS